MERRSGTPCFLYPSLCVESDISCMERRSGAPYFFVRGATRVKNIRDD
jgi:hypothetical protein